MGVTMKKYVNQLTSDNAIILYIGLTDIGRVTQENSNLKAIQSRFPKTWSIFQEDINNSVYLEKGLLHYTGLDKNDLDVAFIPAYDRYCDGDTMIYIFKLLEKLLRKGKYSYNQIIILGMNDLKPEFVKRFVISFPQVFKDYNYEV